jgi:iron complex transport system substrate-binding protein
MRSRCSALSLVVPFLALLAAPPVAAAPGAGGALRITDAAGRTVSLPAPPQRIVVVGRGPYMTLHLLYMFPGAGARIAGSQAKSGPEDFLPLLDRGFAAKPLLESPGPEQVSALHPDLVMIKADRMDQLGAALGAVHVPVAYVGLETQEQFYRDVTNVGTLLGNPARAAAINDYYRSRVDRIRAGWKGVPEAKRPRVLVLEYSDRGGWAAVRVPARPWMQTAEVETAGGRPVWLEAAERTSGWTVVNLEQIARWDPDVIVLAVWYTLDPAQVIAKLKADPRWGALRAVKQGALRAMPMDFYSWDTPDPRWLLGVTWMAKTLYPDRFADLDVAAEVRGFFRTLHGMDDRTIESAIMSKVRLDVR